MLVISAIDRLGFEATPTAIATQEGLRSSNLAAVLRTLETATLISRTPDLQDGRVTRLVLTPAGHQLLAKSRHDRDQWLTQAMEDVLTPYERQALIQVSELLGRLAESPKR
ncbi:MarR family transcriptional regulator [Pseudomonas sp. MWU16-30316]|uniref:MarR family winged helix-turn-helix transcriptional regulator n=1 Tax=Pseudomonas sp. MWU16-30316 TaxID=2878093 RepID=UPI001CF8F372|nr:MarR family transcriptional regulator [Pseudomonas sp. MWU16-30316]